MEVSFENADPKPPVVMSDVDGVVLDSFVVKRKDSAAAIVHVENVNGLVIADSSGLKTVVAEKAVAS